jgi:hypothetical protein
MFPKNLDMENMEIHFTIWKWENNPVEKSMDFIDEDSTCCVE